ncbi:hypothetical protein ACFLTH_16355 [Bacteroidota bacterium]
MVNSKQWIGIVLLVVGVLIAVAGLLSFINATSTFSFVSGAMAIVALFVGGVLIIIGGVVLFLVNLGKIHQHVAQETAPGVETTSEAIGKGLSEGFEKKE